MRNKTKTFSEKVADLINPAPDVESEEEDCNKQVYEEPIPEDTDIDEDHEQVSTLRKRNALLLEDYDEKYSGRKISRKALKAEWGDLNGSEKTFKLQAQRKPSKEDDSDISEEEERDADDEEEGESADETSSEGEGNEFSSDGGSDAEMGFDIAGAESTPSSPHDDVTVFQQEPGIDAETELEKARATKCQLSLWDNILEGRMLLQKCLQSANQLPQFDTYQKFKEAGKMEFRSHTSALKSSLDTLLGKLVNLQEVLLKSHPETRGLAKEKKKETASDSRMSDEEITSDTEEEDAEKPVPDQSPPLQPKKRKLNDYSELLTKRHKIFVPYRNSVIQKWNDKTRVVSGNVNRTMSGFEQPTLKQIEHVLADKQRLVKRTQMKRSAYEVLGKQRTDTSGNLDISSENMKYFTEYDEEIFDDSDFYQLLLRALIDNKSEDTTEPVILGRKWLELQKIRTKMKKVSDLKGTKGRKIRYDVHSKLVNFMAPVMTSTWTEESKNELYKSLFGSDKYNRELKL